MKSNFLNVKFILIFVFLIILIIALVLSFFLINKSNSTPIELSSNDNSFKITIPGNIKFEQRESTTLDLFSKKDEMMLSTTVIAKERDLNVQDVAALEMTRVSNLRSSVDNLSSLDKLELKDYEAYKYSYTYYDEEYPGSFYSEIVWIKTEKNLYVIDCEVVLKNKEKYIPLFNDIIYSFEEM